VVNDIRQDLIGHDAPAMSRVCHGHVGMVVGMVVSIMSLEATGKRMSPVRPRILPSPILPPEVTSTKNSCLLDDFLVVEMLIKRKIMDHTSWSGGIRMFFCISTSRNTIILD